MLNLIAIVVSGGLGVYLLRRSFRLRKMGRFTKGRVVKFEQGPRGERFAVIRFNTPKGRFEMNGGGLFSTCQLGDPVLILYNPKNPREGIIYSFAYLWLLPLGLMGFGLYMFYDLIVQIVGSLK